MDSFVRGCCQESWRGWGSGGVVQCCLGYTGQVTYFCIWSCMGGVCYWMDSLVRGRNNRGVKHSPQRGLSLLHNPFLSKRSVTLHPPDKTPDAEVPLCWRDSSRASASRYRLALMDGYMCLFSSLCFVIQSQDGIVKHHVTKYCN